MKLSPFFHRIKAFRLGDCVLILLSTLFVIWLYTYLWHHAPAKHVSIMQGNTVVGHYSLNQTRDIHVKGALGESVIQIVNGRARFLKSPCTNQYCVHQGWLSRAGQAAICLPNALILQLSGASLAFDTLSY